MVKAGPRRLEGGRRRRDRKITSQAISGEGGEGGGKPGLGGIKVGVGGGGCMKIKTQAKREGGRGKPGVGGIKVGVHENRK